MDEVITCKCGNQKWVIGKGGVRCSVCAWFLPEEWVKADISLINEKIKALKEK